MIPMVVNVDVASRPRRRPGRGEARVVHLWLPLFLLWLLLLPFAVLLSPFLLLALLIMGRRSMAVAGAAYHAFAALSGTLIEVDSPDAFVFIRIH